MKNMKLLREENDGSEQPTSSDPGHLHLMRKIVAEEVERQMNVRGEMVVETVPQEINPAFNIEVFREMVKEEIEKCSTDGTRNDVAEERSLHLKFLDEVSGPIQTSKEFRAVKDGPMKVALVDASGNIVNIGPESSAEVEILLIDASGNGKECAMTNENFERRIIRAGDKEKPHFAKNVFVNLDNGVGSLTNQKLGQDSGWTKNWTCRLGARLVGNFRGLKVQKAWTAPFKVIDNCRELYKTYEVPSPNSEVWRVKEIGRKGEPCKRLERKLIKTAGSSNSKDNYAFINGIEIISVPSTISYCHGGDSGVRVLSRPSIVFSYDNSTALERVHRQNIKWASASSRDDIGGMFGIWYSNLEENAAEEDNAMIWRVSVDVGFRYLVRLHFCEVEHQMDFRILIDDMVAFTSADKLQQRGDQSFLWYETYMVMVEGRK